MRKVCYTLCMIQTKPKTLTYKGKPARVWDYLKTSNKLGERVVAKEWLNPGVHYEGVDNTPVAHLSGVIYLSHVKGDGRTPNFEVYGSTVVDTVEQATAFATRKLGA